jgi:hypothetical protein
MKYNVSFYPVGVGLLGSDAVVLAPDDISYLIKKLWFSGMSMAIS